MKAKTSIPKGKICPNCNEIYKPYGKFCVKYCMFLSYNSHLEISTEYKQKIKNNTMKPKSIYFGISINISQYNLLNEIQ